MYPKICPVCEQPVEHAGRGFEHISMWVRGQSRGTLFLRCVRCNNTFSWNYGELAKEAAERAVGESVGQHAATSENGQRKGRR